MGDNEKIILTVGLSFFQFNRKPNLFSSEEFGNLRGTCFTLTNTQ